ncbi:MAG: HipA family kinase [Terriglobales bacterium]
MIPAEAGFARCVLAVQAVQHVKRMRGGAQSHLMRADDNNFYVVKFQNNPQHQRVLANDFFATKLAERVGLPVPVVEIVEVDGWLVEHTTELNFQLANSTVPCQAGLQFGSRYVIDPLKGQVLDYLPESMIGQIRNVEAFAGILALDKWTCNADGRQAAFWRKLREKKYTATFIDQGYCFNAGEWSFPDAPLRGVFLRNDVYIGVTGWESFEPWLTHLEEMPVDEIAACAEDIPPEWYEHDYDGLSMLVQELDRRRKRVRRLIEEFRKSSRMPFPNWRDERDERTVPAMWGAAERDLGRWN